MDVLNTLIMVYAALFGLCFGSFANVVIYRVPLGKSVVFPGSYCPACDTPLRPVHLIPVLSWLFLRGKCAYCGVRISFRYTLVEVMTALMFALMLIRFPAWGLFYCGLALVLIITAFIDVQTRKVPVSVLVSGTVLGAALAAYRSYFAGKGWDIARDAALNALLGMGVMLVPWLVCRFVLKRPVFTVRDAALTGVCGLFFTPGDMAVAFCFASALYAVRVIYRLIRRGCVPVHLGAYLCAGALLQLAIRLSW